MRERKREKEQTRKGEKREGFYREELYLLSRFPGDRSGKLWRVKKQSCSPWQGLRVGTGFGEFRQTPKGRGFLLLVLFFI